MKFFFQSLRTFLFLILFGMGFSAQAQIPGAADSVANAFFPALAYNSDLGLVGGGLFSNYQYKDDQKPFYSHMKISALASTKGLIQTVFFYDKPNAFGSKLRVTTDTYLSRFLQNQYYGIGNYEQLEDEPEDKHDYYQFKSFSTGLEVTLRYPVMVTEKEHHLDVFSLIIFDYETPWGNGSSSLMEEEKPLGHGGARTAALGTGFIWEARDSEFTPTKGIYFNTTAEFGQKLFGSSYNYFNLKTDARAYTSFFLLREVTFANRLYYQNTSGAVPYWKMAEVGGEVTLRGYPNRRFLDNNSIIFNTEFRTWILNFPEYDARFGGTVFMDVGRSFPNGASFDTVINDLKYVFGFGGTGSFYTPDFILRGDVGFSDEGVGIYFTAGYMF